MVIRLWLFTGLAMLLATSGGPAGAVSVNIDFELAGQGNNFGNPANTYGAAANQAGFWNSVPQNAVAPGVALNDLQGNATNAKLTLSRVVQAANENNTGTTKDGDDEKLLDDQIGSATTFEITISGLPDSLYEVFVYGWASGFPHQHVTGVHYEQFESGRLIPSSFLLLTNESNKVFTNFKFGSTHASYLTQVKNSSNIEVEVRPVPGDHGEPRVNGIQIKQITIPEPSTAWLSALGLGVIAAAARTLRSR